jgi:hypothetical protein
MQSDLKTIPMSPSCLVREAAAGNLFLFTRTAKNPEAPQNWLARNGTAETSAHAYAANGGTISGLLSTLRCPEDDELLKRILASIDASGASVEDLFLGESAAERDRRQLQINTAIGCWRLLPAQAI